MSEIESNDEEAAVDLDILLSEYRALLVKVTDAIGPIFDRRKADVACAPGCSHCCVGHLTVLPVEAVNIETYIDAHGFTKPPVQRPGACSFLDKEGACTIYPARPLVCRTHGLAMRMPKVMASVTEGADTARRLKVLREDGTGGDDIVEVCQLNFTERAPDPADVIDATTQAMLLLTVNNRFTEQVDFGGEIERVPLGSIAAAFLEEAEFEEAEFEEAEPAEAEPAEAETGGDD